MKAILLAMAMLLVPGSTAAQEPIRVCTELVAPDGTSLHRAAPQDGVCTVVLYLPLALADATALAAIADLAAPAVPVRQPALMGDYSCLALGDVRLQVEPLGLFSIASPIDTEQDWLVHEQDPPPGTESQSGDGLWLTLRPPTEPCPPA